MAEGGDADDAGQQHGEHGAREALAHALLLEAVDCIRQAGQLVRDQDAGTALSAQADGLERLAMGLLPRTR